VQGLDRVIHRLKFATRVKCQRKLDARFARGGLLDAGKSSCFLAERFCFKPERCQGGAPGVESPQVNKEEAHAGDDGFLFPNGTSLLIAEDIAGLGEAAPIWIPLEHSPDGFTKSAANPTVTLAINTAEHLAFARAESALEPSTRTSATTFAASKVWVMGLASTASQRLRFRLFTQVFPSSIFKGNELELARNTARSWPAGTGRTGIGISTDAA